MSLKRKLERDDEENACKEDINKCGKLIKQDNVINSYLQQLPNLIIDLIYDYLTSCQYYGASILEDKIIIYSTRILDLIHGFKSNPFSDEHFQQYQCTYKLITIPAVNAGTTIIKRFDDCIYIHCPQPICYKYDLTTQTLTKFGNNMLQVKHISVYKPNAVNTAISIDVKRQLKLDADTDVDTNADATMEQNLIYNPSFNSDKEQLFCVNNGVYEYTRTQGFQPLVELHYMGGREIATSRGIYIFSCWYKRGTATIYFDYMTRQHKIISFEADQQKTLHIQFTIYKNDDVLLLVDDSNNVYEYSTITNTCQILPWKFKIASLRLSRVNAIYRNDTIIMLAIDRYYSLSDPELYYLKAPFEQNSWVGPIKLQQQIKYLC